MNTPWKWVKRRLIGNKNIFLLRKMKSCLKGPAALVRINCYGDMPLRWIPAIN